MTTSFASTFLACGGIFILCFVAIWAFWFAERLRGTSAPTLLKVLPDVDVPLTETARAKRCASYAEKWVMTE